MLFKISMFFLSFTPLWISVVFIDVRSIITKPLYSTTEIVSIIVILLSSIISVLLMKKRLKKTNVDSSLYVLEEVTEDKMITADFFATFILPLFVFDFSKWDSVVIFAIFFCYFGALFIRHNIFTTNIFLEVLNYRVYNCSLKSISNTKQVYLKKVIIDKNLGTIKGMPIKIKTINNEFYLFCSEMNNNI